MKKKQKIDLILYLLFLLTSLLYLLPNYFISYFLSHLFYQITFLTKISYLTSFHQAIFYFFKKTTLFLLFGHGVYLYFYLLFKFIFSHYDLIFTWHIRQKKKIVIINQYILQIKIALGIIFLILAISFVWQNSTYYFGFYQLLMPSKIATYYGQIFADLDLTSGESSHNFLLENELLVFPEPTKIILTQLDLTNDAKLPSNKDEDPTPVIITFQVDDISLKTYGTIKVQGSSTALWPKKNLALQFYQDEAHQKPIKIKIGSSVASNKWIAKAEWNDPTLLRNFLSYQLWGSMVASRQEEIKNEVDYALVGQEKQFKRSFAQGYPFTYPIHVNIAGEHYGLSLLLLGHESANFNLDQNKEEHLYLQFDARGGYTPIKTWEKFTTTGIGEWLDFYYPNNDAINQRQREALEQLGRFINAPLADFKANFHQYLDLQNMIDMLLLYEVIYDWDAVAQDIEIVTYDLQKWYFLPWDKDTSFGMTWNEQGLIENAQNMLLFNYKKEQEPEKPWYKTYHAFATEVEARYASLRRQGVFSVLNLERLANDLYKKIPDELWQVELKRWQSQGRPALEETSKEQILSWFAERLILLDQHFNFEP